MRPFLLYALLALSLLGTKCVYDHGQRQAGVWQERARVADSTAKALGRTIRVTDTAYTTDSAAWRASERRYAHARRIVDSLLRVPPVVESLPGRVDTVQAPPIPVEVVRWVVAEADSTIQACRSVVQTCEQRVAQRDSLNAILSQRLKIEQARRPAGWKRWAERAAWAGLVVLVAK